MLWNTDSLGLGGLGYGRAIIEDIREWTTKRTEKKIYIMVGSTLVKVLIEATMNESFGKANMFCKVLEIDGRELAIKEQEEKSVSIRRFNNVVPTQQEQVNLLLETLGKHNIHGRPALVSDDYARGHIRMLEMKRRLATRGKEAESCS